MSSQIKDGYWVKRTGSSRFTTVKGLKCSSQKKKRHQLFFGRLSHWSPSMLGNKHTKIIQSSLTDWCLQGLPKGLSMLQTKCLSDRLTTAASDRFFKISDIKSDKHANFTQQFADCAEALNFSLKRQTLKKKKVLGEISGISGMQPEEAMMAGFLLHLQVWPFITGIYTHFPLDVIRRHVVQTSSFEAEACLKNTNMITCSSYKLTSTSCQLAQLCQKSDKIHLLTAPFSHLLQNLFNLCKYKVSPGFLFTLDGAQTWQPHYEDRTFEMLHADTAPSCRWVKEFV